MADITINAAVGGGTETRIARSGIYWRSSNVGYLIYLNGSHNICYQKTTDAGQTWGSEVQIEAGGIGAFDTWPDWATPGDTGTKIHISYMDVVTDCVHYNYLDTSDDSYGSEITVEAAQGNGTINGLTFATGSMTSITKSVGGKLAIAFHYKNDDTTTFDEFYTSTDGSSWTKEADPWEGDAADYLYLFPGNAVDEDDLWGIYWDSDASALSLKVYDDSGDSWGETAIAGSMVFSAVNPKYSYGGAIRHSDGHLLLGAWNLYDNAAADLMTWDINGAASITAKTNAITDTAEYMGCDIFVNHETDDVYIVYLGGTALGSEVGCNYQKSTDGMGTWSGDTAFDADAEDDHRWLGAGCMHPTGGGRFMPVWFNDDLADIMTNYDNSVAIHRMAATTGALALSGTTVSLLATRLLECASGAITLNGSVVGFIYDHPLIAESGSFTLVGTEVDLRADRTLPLETGVLTLNGTAVGILATRKIAATSGSLALSGTAVDILAARKLAVAPGALTLVGTDVVLDWYPWLVNWQTPWFL